MGEYHIGSILQLDIILDFKHCSLFHYYFMVNLLFLSLEINNKMNILDQVGEKKD